MGGFISRPKPAPAPRPEPKPEPKPIVETKVDKKYDENDSFRISLNRVNIFDI